MPCSWHEAMRLVGSAAMATPTPKHRPSGKQVAPTPFATHVQKVRNLAQTVDRDLTLARGATASALKQMARKLGFQPGEALKQAWTLGNGSDEGAPLFARPGFLSTYEFLSIDQMLAERAGIERRAPQYKDYEEPEARDRRIRPGWYHAGWVPFASLAGATMLLIEDHSPSAKGATGQIIAFTHDPDEMSWVARDFASLLKGSLQVFKKNAVEAAGVMVGPATASSRVAVGAACDGLACGARRPIEDARSQPDQQSSAKVRKKRIRHLRASYAPHV